MRLNISLYSTIFCLALSPLSVLGEEPTTQQKTLTLTNSEEQKIKSFTLAINNRKVNITPNVIRVVQGDTVNLIWSSDEKAKLHLHGYDIEFEVDPSAPQLITFIATASGRFSVTSHAFSGDQEQGHKALIYLEVYPE